MSKVEKISIALTSDMLSDIRAAVACGDYASTSEALRDAVREWRENRRERELTSELKTLVAEAEASGYVDEFDLDEIKRRGRERMSSRQ